MMFPRISKLSQDKWHCAMLENVFSRDFYKKISDGFGLIDWVEARKDFYIQRESNLRLVNYYINLFDEKICKTIASKVGDFFGVDFDLNFDIVAHKMIEGDYIGIHTDLNSYGESHRLTLIVNDDWSIDQGGVLLTLDGRSLDNIKDAWLPSSNTGFIFEINEASYHAVTPVKGKNPRYSIIFTFKKINNKKDRQFLWSCFPLAQDVSSATSTAKFMNIDSENFSEDYQKFYFESVSELSSYIGHQLDNAPVNFSYKNGVSMNVDENGVQTKGSDEFRVNAISELKRVPPVIIVRRKNKSFTLVDGSHRLSYAKDNNLGISVVFFDEKF